MTTNNVPFIITIPIIINPFIDNFMINNTLDDSYPERPKDYKPSFKKLFSKLQKIIEDKYSCHFTISSSSSLSTIDTSDYYESSFNEFGFDRYDSSTKDHSENIAKLLDVNFRKINNVILNGIIFKKEELLFNSEMDESFFPSYYAFKLIFISSKTPQKCSNFNDKEVKTIKKTIEDICMDELQIDAFVYSPMLGLASENKKSIFYFNFGDINPAAFYIKTHTKRQLLNLIENNKIESEKQQCYPLDFNLSRLLDVKINKKNLYQVHLQYGSSFPAVLYFDQTHAYFIIKNHDLFLSDVEFFVQNNAFAPFSLSSYWTKNLSVSIFNESDHNYFFLSLSKGVFDINRFRELSKYSLIDSNIIPFVRKQYKNIQPNYSTNSYYLEQIKSSLVNIELSSIGIAAYIEHDSGEYFHAVASLYAASGALLAEESMSVFTGAEESESLSIYQFINSMESLAKELKINHFFIEREDDYELFFVDDDDDDNYSFDNECIFVPYLFPRAEAQQVAEENRAAIVFVLRYENSDPILLPKEKIGDLTNAIYQALYIHSSRQPLIKLTVSPQLKYLAHLVANNEELNISANDYAHSLKANLLEGSPVHMFNEKTKSMMEDITRPGTIAFGAVIEADSSVIDDIRALAGSIKKGSLISGRNQTTFYDNLKCVIAPCFGLSAQNISYCDCVIRH